MLELEKLQLKFKPKNDYAEIFIHNFTTILSKFERFFKSWLDFASKSGADLLEMSEVRAKLLLEFQKLANCHSDTSE